MTLLPRERPPLRLSVNIETPDGVYARWGWDDPNPANGPQNLTFTTVMPGGFEQMNTTLERKVNLQYQDLQELATVTVRGVGGAVAWQGRLEDIPDTGGTEAQSNPQCTGYQSHLDDDGSATMVYIDRQLASWQPQGSTQRQINLITGGFNTTTWSEQTTSVGVAGSPAIFFSATGAFPATPEVLGEVWYDSGAGNLIAQIRSPLITGIGLSSSDADNIVDILSASDDVATLSSGSNILPSTTGIVQNLTNYRYGLMQVIRNGAGGSAGLTYSWALENVAVIGNHGLTIYAGQSGVSPGVDDGLLASDIIAHAVGKWCPLLSFTTGTNGSIQPSAFVIPQLVFNSPTTSSVIIKQAAQYELLDWAIWEGPTFYANQRGARGNQWQARVGPSQLQETGPQISRLWNGVIVQYTDAAGVTQYVGPIVDPDPDNPANQAGIKRYSLVTMGTSTAAAATQVGTIFLQEQKLVDTSGQATLTGHIKDSSGNWWPAWAVRAGDYITFVDASDPSPRRVVSTSYDDTAKANTIQLDQPPDGLQAILERLSIVLSPLGLS